MKADKPTWWSFFTWLLVGVALTFSILGAMTIGIFVLPFALVSLFALFKWGGNRRSSVGLLSGVGLPVLYMAYINRQGPGMVCGPYKSGGEQCTQEYSPWPFLLTGLFFVALGVVMFLRIRSGSGISKNFRGMLVLILVVSILAFGFFSALSTRSPTGNESVRIKYSMNAIFTGLAKRGDVSTQTRSPIRVGVVSFQDGSKASLWVPNFAMTKPRSYCFTVDLVANSSGPSGFFDSLCSDPKPGVILERQNSVVVGYIGLTKAHEVSIKVLDITLVVPMVFGYFLVPGSISGDPRTKFTITYTEPGQATCEIRDLSAPGVSALFHCVIA